MATKKKTTKTVKKSPAKKKPVKKAAPKAAKKPVKKTAPKAAKKTVKKAAPRTAKKPVKKAAPKAAKKPVKKATPAKPRVKPAAEPRPQIPEKEEKVALERLSSPLIQDQKPGGSALKIAIPVILIIVIVAAAYMYFTQGKIDTKIEPASVEPAVEKIDEEQPAVKQEAEKEAEVAEEIEEPVTPAADTGNVYTVKYKDRLNTISKDVYGNYADWKKIFEANKNKIDNPNLIFPGQKLKIPER